MHTLKAKYIVEENYEMCLWIEYICHDFKGY